MLTFCGARNFRTQASTQPLAVCEMFTKKKASILRSATSEAACRSPLTAGIKATSKDSEAGRGDAPCPNFHFYCATCNIHAFVNARRLFSVCRACSTAGGCKSLTQPDGGEGLAKRKGENNTGREAGPERSVEQRREPMNKNRIRGLRWRASGQMTAKPISIKLTGGKSGGCASKAVELTSGDLRHVTKS